jgi:hypothetical protein
MKTSRLTVLLDPVDKRALESRAAAMSVSTSELVRRAVEIYDPDIDPKALRELADEITAAARRIDAKIADVAGLIERIGQLPERRDAWRAEARAELARGGADWPFDELG